MARTLSQFRLQTRGLCCLKTLSRTSTTAAASQQTAQNELEMEVKPFSSIPGPKPLPVVGIMFELRRNINRMQDYYGECFDKYGDIFKYEVPGLLELMTTIASIHKIERLL